MIGYTVRIHYHKKSCLYVFIFLSVAHFSANACPIWTMLGRKMGTISAFVNPENQDIQSHSTNSIL